MADGQQPGAAGAVPPVDPANAFSVEHKTSTVFKAASVGGLPPSPPGIGDLPVNRPSVPASNPLKDWKLWALIAFFLFLIVLVLVASNSSMKTEMEQGLAGLTAAKADLDKANAANAELSKKLKTTEGELEKYKAVKPGATPEEIEAIVKKAVGNCRASIPNVTLAPASGVRPAPAQTGFRPVDENAGGDYLLWHHYEATAAAPSMCIISGGGGAGLPPYCSGYKVMARNQGETKADWLVRVGGGGRPGDTGLYNKGKN